MACDRKADRTLSSRSDSSFISTSDSQQSSRLVALAILGRVLRDEGTNLLFSLIERFSSFDRSQLEQFKTDSETHSTKGQQC